MCLPLNLWTTQRYARRSIPLLRGPFRASRITRNAALPRVRLSRGWQRLSSSTRHSRSLGESLLHDRVFGWVEGKHRLRKPGAFSEGRKAVGERPRDASAHPVGDEAVGDPRVGTGDAEREQQRVVDPLPAGTVEVSGELHPAMSSRIVVDGVLPGVDVGILVVAGPERSGLVVDWDCSDADGRVRGLPSDMERAGISAQDEDIRGF